jgi:hypothetical protein
MPQPIPVMPVALETGSWPTFRLSMQERLEIIKGRGLHHAQGAPGGPLLATTNAPPLQEMEAAKVVAAQIGDAVGPGGVRNTGGRTIDEQGNMVGPAVQSVPPPVPPATPGGLKNTKTIRTSGPNLPSSRP